MKKITLMMASALFCLTASAQIGSQDFEAGLPGDWTFTTVTGECDWESNMATPTGDDFTSLGVLFNDDACGNGAPASNMEILSPVYDLSATSGDVTLSYDLYFQVAGFQTFDVEAYDGAAWQSVATYDADLAGGIISPESFDLSGYTNADFQVRYTYDDNQEWGWGAGIDNFLLDETLSLQDNNIAGLSIYPNPAVNELNISATSTIDNVKVFNLLGQVVLDQKVNGISGTFEVSGLRSGAYLVQVTSEGQIGTYKLLKQ